MELGLIGLLGKPVGHLVEAAVVAAAMDVVVPTVGNRTDAVRVVADAFGMSESSVQRRLRVVREMEQVAVEVSGVNPFDCWRAMVEEGGLKLSAGFMSDTWNRLGSSHPLDCAA